MTNRLILKTDGVRLLLRASVAMISGSVNRIHCSKPGEMFGLLSCRDASAMRTMLVGSR
jgi:hypothetical protein